MKSPSPTRELSTKSYRQICSKTAAVIGISVWVTALITVSYFCFENEISIFGSSVLKTLHDSLDFDGDGESLLSTIFHTDFEKTKTGENFKDYKDSHSHVHSKVESSTQSEDDRKKQKGPEIKIDQLSKPTPPKDLTNLKQQKKLENAPSPTSNLPKQKEDLKISGNKNSEKVEKLPKISSKGSAKLNPKAQNIRFQRPPNSNHNRGNGNGKSKKSDTIQDKRKQATENIAAPESKTIKQVPKIQILKTQQELTSTRKPIENKFRKVDESPKIIKADGTQLPKTIESNPETLKEKRKTLPQKVLEVIQPVIKQASKLQPETSKDEASKLDQSKSSTGNEESKLQQLNETTKDELSKLQILNETIEGQTSKLQSLNGTTEDQVSKLQFLNETKDEVSKLQSLNETTEDQASKLQSLNETAENESSKSQILNEITEDQASNLQSPNEIIEDQASNLQSSNEIIEDQALKLLLSNETTEEQSNETLEAFTKSTLPDSNNTQDEIMKATEVPLTESEQQMYVDNTKEEEKQSESSIKTEDIKISIQDNSLPPPKLTEYNSGEIRSASMESRCLDAGNSEGSDIILYKCHGLGGNQKWNINSDNELRKGNLCADYFGGPSILIFNCHKNQGNQMWIYDLTKQTIYHPSTNTCLTLTEKAKAEMTPCEDGKETQKWIWNNN